MLLQEAANAGCNNPTIRIVGHSLGGALAQYVASYKNKTGVSYNAPGVPMPSGGGTNVVNFSETWCYFFSFLHNWMENNSQFNT